MNPAQFDRLARALSAETNRRRMLSGILGASLARLHLAEQASAKQKDKVKCTKDKHCRDGKVCVNRTCTCPEVSCCCNCLEVIDGQTGEDFVSACHTDVFTREECIARCGGPANGHGFGCVAAPSLIHCGLTGRKACTRTPPDAEYPAGCGCLVATCPA